jgi:hypothetical protein
MPPKRGANLQGDEGIQMSNQDREVVKNLLQYMTEKCLTGSPEFKAALKHFNITTTYQDRGYSEEDAKFCGRGLYYIVDVNYPDGTIDRSQFGTELEAKEFAAQERAIGDQPEAETTQEFSVYQRADGMQVAVNKEGITCYMRPLQSVKWINAGFQAILDHYWLVQGGVKIWGNSQEIARYKNGVLEVEIITAA